MHSPSRLEASSRNSRAKSLPPTTFSINSINLSTQLLALVHLLSRCYTPAAYPECRRQNTTAISRTVGAHAPAVTPAIITVVIQAHPVRASSCMKILLTLRMRPAAIALNYSIKNIRNDVRQKIIIIFDEKSQFDSLVWGEREQ